MLSAIWGMQFCEYGQGGGDRCVRELKVARVGKDKLARFDKVLAQVNTQGYARFQW
jgi:hypothetical protein